MSVITPSTTKLTEAIATSEPGSTARWLIIVLALLAPFTLYFDTAKSIVDIWNSSETFAHGYAILPMCLWLVWRRRANFSSMPPTPYWPALALLALAGFAWLLGRLGEVQVVQQYAFAAMLPLIALAMFGRRLAASLAFPLLFVLAAVPFGEIFINPLISFTADFTVAAVQATGIPVLRNGTHFEIPSGRWSVVEACSGVRYLISSVTIGLLYAYLTYRSTTRRVVFVLFSIIVPIVANGLRAFMIVMIGHFSGMTLAVGVDHLIYGWAFFGLVMFAMFWVGNYWRQDTDPAPAAAAVRAAGPNAGALLPIAVAVVALAALWPAFAAYNARATANPQAVQLAAFGVRWQAASSFSSWTPDYMAPDASFRSAYRASADSADPVGLTVLYYRNQNRGKALISSVNRIAGNHNAFSQTGSTLRTEQVAGRSLVLRETRLTAATGSLLVWHWNWVDHRFTANDYLGKLWQAQAKLLFRADDGAVVMVAAPFSDKPDEARKALRAFVDANLTPIESALIATGRR
jgi:exosortase A